MSTVIYRSGTLTVRAGYDELGRLSIEGRDRGGHPVTDDYAYFIRVEPEHFPLLRRAWGADAATDLVDLLVAHGAGLVEGGETSWLEGHDIPFTLYAEIH